jgi:hypothetical protein
VGTGVWRRRKGIKKAMRASKVESDRSPRCRRHSLEAFSSLPSTSLRCSGWRELEV